MARVRRSGSRSTVPIAALYGDAAGNAAAADLIAAGVVHPADLLRLRRELRQMRHEKAAGWSRWSLAIMAGWQFAGDDGNGETPCN